MGRSVSTPCESVAVAYKNLYAGFDDEYIEEFGEPDECIIRDEFDSLEEWVKETVKARWSSFDEDEKWLDREDRALLSNGFARVGISEYCGLVAIWLVSRADEYESSCYSEDRSLAALANSWCEKIASNFEKTFTDYERIGVCSNGEAIYKAVS